MRTLIWALVRCSRATVAFTCSEPRPPASTRPTTATTPRNRSSSTSVVSKLAPDDEKNRDSRITVAKSAIDAPAITSWPNGVPVFACVERDLKAGEEEQEHQSDRREHRQRSGVVDQVEDHRTDQDPGHDLADNRRDLRQWQQIDQQRRRRGGAEHDGQVGVVEPFDR